MTTILKFDELGQNQLKALMVAAMNEVADNKLRDITISINSNQIFINIINLINTYKYYIFIATILMFLSIVLTACSSCCAGGFNIINYITYIIAEWQKSKKAGSTDSLVHFFADKIGETMNATISNFVAVLAQFRQPNIEAAPESVPFIVQRSVNGQYVRKPVFNLNNTFGPQDLLFKNPSEEKLEVPKSEPAVFQHKES